MNNIETKAPIQKVWWSYYWRFVSLSILIAGGIGFCLGFAGKVFGISEELRPMMPVLQNVIGFLVQIPVSYVIFKYIITDKYQSSEQ